MTIAEILEKIHSFKMKAGRLPKSSYKEMEAISREGHRKIGSWRKMLWLARTVPDERKRQLPQLSFAARRGSFRLDAGSRGALAALCSREPFKKERVV